MQTKAILITGASSGIGEATARRLAADGHQAAAPELAIPANVDVSELSVRPTAQC